MIAPECVCGCTTHAAHVALFPDLAPRGDDLPEHAPLGEPGGDAMTVTWGQP